MSATPTIDLDTIDLQSGSHDSRDSGVCLMEMVAWYAGEDHSDMPACVSPVLRRFGMRLNDRLPHERRQELKRFIPDLIGTANDGKDPVRRQIAADYAFRSALPRWLDLAGLGEEAAKLREHPIDLDGRAALYALTDQARDAAWKLREARREQIKAAVMAELAKRERPAAAADAVADAAAAAAADAAAAAAADAAAAAAAAADAAASKFDTWGAAYRAALPIFEKAYQESDTYAAVRALGEQQIDEAFELYARLIKGEVAA